MHRQCLTSKITGSLHECGDTSDLRVDVREIFPTHHGGLGCGVTLEYLVANPAFIRVVLTTFWQNILQVYIAGCVGPNLSSRAYGCILHPRVCLHTMRPWSHVIADK